MDKTSADGKPYVWRTMRFMAGGPAPPGTVMVEHGYVDRETGEMKVVVLDAAGEHAVLLPLGLPVRCLPTHSPTSVNAPSLHFLPSRTAFRSFAVCVRLVLHMCRAVLNCLHTYSYLFSLLRRQGDR